MPIRRAVALVGICAIGAGGAQAQGIQTQSLDAGRMALRTGRYEEAISIFERLSAAPNAPPGAARFLIRAYHEVGKYDEAERAAARFAASPRIATNIANVMGEVYFVRGKLSEAEAAFRKAVAEKAPDSLSALLNLAILEYERGRRDEAMRQFDHFIDVYNRGGDLSADDLIAVAVACRYLGLDTPVLFRDALKAFDRAIATDSMSLEPQVRVGELFLEKYNSPDAQSSFDAVLAVNPKHPRALLGTANRRLFDSQGGADSLITLALASNPNLIEAHIVRAESRLGVEDYAGARESVEQALRVDPGSPAALSVVSAIQFLNGDTAAHLQTNAKVLARNPKYADLFVTLARLSARNRLYAQAVVFARRAVELDPQSWGAHAELGTNLLRTGAIAEGRASLDTTFAHDPYNVWVKNTLDLLDTFKDYDVIETGKFRLMIGKQESALLSLCASDLLERAYDSLSARYGYSPQPPVRVEFYRRHADFSVRTVGLAGIGALGVSFGNVLAMDSPTARETGPFNWGSVLWHELAHTFTLGLTNHKIPRWFSEGLSVYEERKAGTVGWGADATGDFLRAFKAELLYPVSALNDGFMRPRYPEQLLHSYYQASLVCEMIAEMAGEKAIIAMLHAYRDGKSTEEVFRSALNQSMEQVDQRFNAYVRSKFTAELDAVGAAGIMTVGRGGGARATQQPDSGEFAKAMAEGIAAKTAGNADGAVASFRRAIALFPHYAGDDSPYVQIALILAERGDVKGAADQLARHNAINENSYTQHIAESLYREGLGDFAAAAKILDRAMYIYPYDIKTHERLAGLATRVGDRKMAVRERRAVVALNPVDRAEAYYQLALALHESGDNAAARREVLRSLEDAPNFEKAQALLLKIRGGGENPMERQ